MLFPMRNYFHCAIGFICYWSLLYNKKLLLLKKIRKSEVSYYFATVNYYFAGKNWEKPILLWHLFASANYYFAYSNWEKPRQKNLNCKGCYDIHHVTLLISFES